MLYNYYTFCEKMETTMQKYYPEAVTGRQLRCLYYPLQKLMRSLNNSSLKIYAIILPFYRLKLSGGNMHSINLLNE